MASPTVEQQTVQAAIAQYAAQRALQLWPALDLEQLEATLPAFTAQVAAELRPFGLASASVAADYYLEERAAARVTGQFTVTPADPAPVEQVARTVRWATRGLWDPQPDVTGTRADLSAAVEKLVIDTGRNTIINATREDRKAHGWARTVEPGACAFCLLLAQRGPVYKSSTVGFRSHDRCRCHAQPVFGPWEPTHEVRQAQALYQQAKNAGSARQVRAKFRQLIEAR